MKLRRWTSGQRCQPYSLPFWRKRQVPRSSAMRTWAFCCQDLAWNQTSPSRWSEMFLTSWRASKENLKVSSFNYSHFFILHSTNSFLFPECLQILTVKSYLVGVYLWESLGPTLRMLSSRTWVCHSIQPKTYLPDSSTNASVAPQGNAVFATCSLLSWTNQPKPPGTNMQPKKLHLWIYCSEGDLTAAEMWGISPNKGRK